MTTDGEPAGPSDAELVAMLAAQRQRMDQLRRSMKSGGDLDAALAELEVSHEELRVAEEEMRAQREQIDDLLAQHSGELTWRERIAPALPVPVVVTDRDAVITEVNAAAAFLLGTDRRYLLAKPLVVFVAETDRARFRESVGAVRNPGTQVRDTLTLTTRRGAATEVAVVAFGEPDGAHGHRLTWVVLPASPDGAGPDVDLVAAASFAELCRLPVGPTDDLRSVLGRVAALGRRSVRAADALSVSMGDPTEPELLGTESQLAQAVDGAQVRSGEGPCAQAWRDRERVLANDLGAERRWPRFAELAAPTGVRSVLAVPVRGKGEASGVLGVLNLYATTAGAFDPRSVQVAELFAAALGAVIEDWRDRAALHRLSDQLRSALESRAVIDQAKGMLMVLHGIGPDEAFAQLVHVSRQTNVKLREVAARLVAGSGSQPPKPPVS